MVQKVEKFQARDGRFFDTEEEAAKYEINSDFIQRISEVIASTKIEGNFGEGLEARIRKILAEFLVKNQHSLYDLLAWYRAERDAHDELYKKKEEKDG